jgi:hypothetical protein
MIEFCPFRRRSWRRHYDHGVVDLADRVAELLRRAEAADTSQLHLSHRGTRLAGIGAGGEPIATMSVTKLIVGMIIGRAVRLGLLDLDQPVASWIPEWRDGPKSIITVRHVMGHASGLAADTWPQLNASPPEDFVAYAVHDLPVVAAPGTVLAYNNAAVSVLPAIVTKAADPSSANCWSGAASRAMINCCRRTGWRRSAGHRSRAGGWGCCCCTAGRSTIDSARVSRSRTDTTGRKVSICSSTRRPGWS